MSRSKSSKQWLKEHFDDVYVKRSQEEGYRSRASYKLLEMQEKDGFIKTGMAVVDLGAAPGGWSQVIAKLVGDRGRVISSDILPMDRVAGVNFVQGDFTEQKVFDKLSNCLDDGLADLVISDMAPNMTGVKEIDQPRMVYLSELALHFARSTLKPKGCFLVKTFQGEGFEGFQKNLRHSFKTVKARKPRASRARSREIYLLAVGFSE
jgi:23S rRNA (uridine2552-2'-O)-methyltransferase